MRKVFLLLLAAPLFLSLSSYSPAVTSPVDTVFASAEADYLKGMLTAANFQDSIRALYDQLGLERAGLDFHVFNLGMIGYHNLKHAGKLTDRKNLFTIIDFTKPSTEKRFYTIDFDASKIKYHTYVAHGRNTGENMAKKFSNVPHSNQSSLGFYVTGETYVGSKGYSLKLDGQENYNSNLRKRAVVIHAAPYVSEEWIRKYGRLGRSQGCPALPNHISKSVINTIKNKTAIFAYYNDDAYLKSSAYLDMKTLMQHLETQKALALEGTASFAE
jgi:hypothetical protein